MGLLRNQKLLFCHIAKNGGQTVHKAMSEIEQLEYCDKHYSMIQLKKLINDDSLFNECTKFCIIRNPWDRMVSTYFFRKNKCEEDFGPKDQWNLNFNEWIEYIYSDTYKLLKLKHGNTLDNVIYHFGSSLNWVIDEDGKLLVNKIIMFENIDNELFEIFKTYGYNKYLDHQNSTDHENYKKYYNEKSIQLVAKNFKEDIDYFGYIF
jgi:hypothetical protein